jgi:hypothetical protein
VKLYSQSQRSAPSGFSSPQFGHLIDISQSPFLSNFIGTTGFAGCSKNLISDGRIVLNLKVTERLLQSELRLLNKLIVLKHYIHIANVTRDVAFPRVHDCPNSRDFATREFLSFAPDDVYDLAVALSSANSCQSRLIKPSVRRLNSAAAKRAATAHRFPSTGFLPT